LTEYSDVPKVYHDTGDIKLCERAVLNREIESLKEITRYVEDDVAAIIHGFLEQYEVEVLKDALRFWFDRTIRARDVSDSIPYLYREKIVHDIDLDRLIYTASPGELLDCIEGTPYHEPVSKWIKEREHPGSLYTLETELDRNYFSRLLYAITRLDSRDREIADRIIGLQIDMENIMRLGRFIRFYRDDEADTAGVFIGGGRSIHPAFLNSAVDSPNTVDTLKEGIMKQYGDSGFLEQVKGKRDETVLLLILSLLEEVFDKEVERLLLGYPFTIGIVLAYCFKKRAEVRKIITIINGIKYGVQEERLGRIV
jgi:V/A-type H+-transporting ATPase subunit C